LQRAVFRAEFVKDFHKGLKIGQQQLGRSAAFGVDFLAIEHQWGKADFEYSIHAFPSQFGLSGLQTTDLLALLGFQLRNCAFRNGRPCYSVEVIPGLDLSRFPNAFDAAYGALSEAERHLNSCGFQLPQPEGWGYFTGRTGRRDASRGVLGDGHSAAHIEERNRSEDEAFRFIFGWTVVGPREKGWVTHYRAKNQPVSAEVMQVLEFLGLRSFNQCQFFDFEECWWSSFKYVEDDHRPFNRSIEHATGAFQGLAANFSPGVAKLLEAHAQMEPYGLNLLPISDVGTRTTEDLHKHIDRTRGADRRAQAGGLPDRFDVAISFAGTERQHAEALAKALREAGYDVFYDDFYPAQPVGQEPVRVLSRNLQQTLPLLRHLCFKGIR
jgi:hypothetical protein